MLGVCAEFERIAKVVLDKSEKESHSRRKRKPLTEDKGTPKSMATPNQGTPMRTSGPAPLAPQFSPSFVGTPNGPSYNPSINGFGSPGPDGDMSFMPDIGNADFGDMLTPQNGFGSGFSEAGGPSYPASAVSPLNLGSFQQPFVPQDLWQMPMTLEWDWADMTAGGYNMDGTGEPIQNVQR